MRSSVATEAVQLAMQAATAAEAELILRTRLVAEVDSELLHA